MEPVCSLGQADLIRDHLAGVLANRSDDDLTIDLSPVVEADVSLVQVLVSAARTAATKNIALRFRSSDLVDDLFARSGLPSWLANPRI
jgi:anti-anti-sigma regulatory factor